MVTATYFDGVGDGTDSATASLIGPVLPATNTAPTITGLQAVDYAEDSTAAVATYSATDPDTGDTLTWSLTGGDAISFTFSPTTGTSTTVSFAEGTSPDYETKKSYSFTVKVSDVHGGEDTHSVTVTITNVEEPGTVTLDPETGLRVGQTVTATLTDEDDTAITPIWQWSRDGTPVGTSASYTAVVGDLTAANLTVTATYSDGVGPGTDTATAMIGPVLPTANKAPVVRPPYGRTSISYPENSTASIDFSAVDADPLSWSVGGTDESDFTIAGSDKTASLTFSTPPDYETNALYSVTVTATDGTLAHTVTMTITILDGNDDGTVTLNASELRVGHTVTAMLIDPDAIAAQLAAATWQWSRDGADISGATSSTYTAVEADKGKMLSVTVTYTDAVGDDTDTAKAAMDEGVLARPTTTTSTGGGTTTTTTPPTTTTTPPTTPQTPDTPTTTGKPDLVVRPPRLSHTSVAPGARATLSVTVANLGSGDAPSATLVYYRSVDSTISSADSRVESTTVNALKANTTSPHSINVVEVPNTPGDYYYGACIGSVSGESNTANNCSSGVKLTVSVSRAARNAGCIRVLDRARRGERNSACRVRRHTHR